MDISRLYQFFEDQPRYRVQQAERAVFTNLIDDWQDVSTFPLEWRGRLNEEVNLKINAKLIESRVKDYTKALITLLDNNKIETVLLRHNDGRNTACLSSQVGCPLGCIFCATGQSGFKRNLTSDEIVEQAIFWNRFLKKENQRVTNVVFMGMGEPFLNYDNVLTAIRFLNQPEVCNIGARRISISTIGVLTGIKKLSEEKLQVNLAISLHAADDKLRSKIVPANEKWPLRKILTEVNQYIKKTNRRVMFEYTLIKGMNDSLPQARALARLMKKTLYMVNLIPCNYMAPFQPSDRVTIAKFKRVLEENRVAVTQRYTFGRDIEAACGQLRAREMH